MATVKVMGSKWRDVLMMLGIVSLTLVGSGCAGGKSAEPRTGSLLRTYTLIDEQGQKSGTLVINPIGGAELRDVNGNLIGTLSSQAAPASGGVTQPEAKP